MYTITYEDWQQKLLDHSETIDSDDGPVKVSCPNGIIKEKGKPDVVWAFYNGRKYLWQLVE